MARRRRRSATTTKIVRVGAARSPAPIIRVSAPAPARRRRSFRRGVGRVGGLAGQHNIDVAIGGALYGFAVKSGWVDKLPAIPVIGRTGTAALLLNYWAKRGGGDIVRRTAIAAAALAGYQLGSTGVVTGDDSFATMGHADAYETMGADEELVDDDEE